MSESTAVIEWCDHPQKAKYLLNHPSIFKHKIDCDVCGKCVLTVIVPTQIKDIEKVSELKSQVKKRNKDGFAPMVITGGPNGGKIRLSDKEISFEDFDNNNF